MNNNDCEGCEFFIEGECMPDKYVMPIDVMLLQLRDLIEDRKSFISGDEEHDEVFKKDIKALEMAIDLIERSYKRS